MVTASAAANSSSIESLTVSPANPGLGTKTQPGASEKNGLICKKKGKNWAVVINILMN